MPKMTVVPKFNATTLVNEIIGREWFLAQNAFLAMGKRMHQFMKRYIRNNTKRTGGTGKLARSINFQILSTGAGRIEWGIGNISQLVPYWHVIATGKTSSGKKFRPGGGKYRPVKFSDGNADPSKRGQGNAKANMFIPIGGGRLPSYIRPIPFISVTQAKLGWEIEKLLARLGGAGGTFFKA